MPDEDLWKHLDLIQGVINRLAGPGAAGIRVSAPVPRLALCADATGKSPKFDRIDSFSSFRLARRMTNESHFEG
jgi:hypothetical protein